MTFLGAIACGHPATAATAVEILEDGGNAFDAAIASQFTACVAEPVLTSLGGGGFLLACRPGEEPRLLDFFAHTPKAHVGQPDALRPIEADFGTATQTFHIGAGSVATPGTVAGMFAAHRGLASLPMTRLLEPAARAAREGVVVNDFQGYIFQVVRPIYQCAPYDRAMTGRRLVQPQLAKSLDALADEGEEIFYRGRLAERLLDDCRRQGGHLSEGDLANYRVIERQPLKFEYRGCRIVTNPPPSAGGVLIRHSLLSLDESDPVALTRALQATEQARVGLQAQSEQVSRGTTHISVIDGLGNLASMTLSNGEGSGCMIPESGIMLNNMLGEEDINPRGIGRWQPDVRLGSMMAPTLILGDGIRYALGSGGSNRIRSALLQTIVNLLDRKMPPEAAVHAPRLHVEDGLLSLEPGFADPILEDLAPLVSSIQHWKGRNLFFGGVHLVAHRDDGRFDAVGDPRRGGIGRLANGH